MFRSSMRDRSVGVNLSTTVKRFEHCDADLASNSSRKPKLIHGTGWVKRKTVGGGKDFQEVVQKFGSIEHDFANNLN